MQSHHKPWKPNVYYFCVHMPQVKLPGTRQEVYYTSYLNMFEHGLTFVCYRVLLCWLVLVQLVSFRRRFLAFGDLFLSCCHRLSIRGLFLLACSLFALFSHTPCLCQEYDTMPAIIVATQWTLGVIWWWFSTGFASRTRFYIEWAEAYGKKKTNMKIYLWFQTTDSCILAHALQENQWKNPQRKYKYLQMTVYIYKIFTDDCIYQT